MGSKYIFVFVKINLIKGGIQTIRGVKRLSWKVSEEIKALEFRKS